MPETTDAATLLSRVKAGKLVDRGVSLNDGETLADMLVVRDRESHDRQLCLECQHLASHAGDVEL